MIDRAGSPIGTTGEPATGVDEPGEPEPQVEPTPEVEPAEADQELAAEPGSEPVEAQSVEVLAEPAAEGEPEPEVAVVASAPESQPGPEAEAEPGSKGAPGSEGEPDSEAEELDSNYPNLTEDQALVSALEALLLVVDSPVTEETLATALEQSVARVTSTLRQMADDYTERGSGIDLRRLGDGWRFVTRDQFAPFVEKLLLDGQRARLTRAALETLAVVAYRQPVTRARVAAVRGVNVDGVVRTLLARGLIEETGADSETGGILYRTTELFLERLGLGSLEDLPPIAPLLPEVDAIDDV